MAHYYILRDGVPVATDDVLEWGRWQETSMPERVVAWADVGGYFVSTVFLSLDHAFGGGPPVLWESMVFRSVKEGEPFDGHDYAARHYTSREDALAGHAELVEWVRAGMPQLEE